MFGGAKGQKEIEIIRMALEPYIQKIYRLWRSGRKTLDEIRNDHSVDIKHLPKKKVLSVNQI
jgi:hypothetical protein